MVQGTLAAVRALFASPAGTAAFEEGAAASGRGARWEVQPAIVDASGALEGSDERLQAFDLDREEWDAFTSGIARLAEQQASHPSLPRASTAQHTARTEAPGQRSQIVMRFDLFRKLIAS